MATDILHGSSKIVGVLMKIVSFESIITLTLILNLISGASYFLVFCLQLASVL